MMWDQLQALLPFLFRYTFSEELDVLRSRMDVPDELFDQFQRDRKSPEYQAAYDRPEPLVTACVATYNRGALLVERSVKSLLAQDYRNLEVIVVGDGCTDDTAERMARISDDRLRFVNLAQRGQYPDVPEWRWMVAGTLPINHALELARGDFITHLDDDDEHAAHRISTLLQVIRETRADIVWHPFSWELRPGIWKLNRARRFRWMGVTTSSVLYHNWFKRIPWDINAYRFREPGDWNRFRKFKYLGVKAVRHPEPLLKHYKERTQARR